MENNMFGKPKHIDSLPQEDQSWAQSIGGFGAWKKALEEAVAQNKPRRVRYLMNTHKTDREMRFALCALAVEMNAGAALAAVLEKRGFDFDDSAPGDILHARQLFASALVKKDISVWQALSARNAQEKNSSIGADAPLRLVAGAHWHEGVGWHLQQVAAKDVKSFAVVLAHFSRGTPDDLAFALSWTGKFVGHGEALDLVLASVAETGDVDKLRLLLGKGANPDADGGAAIYQTLAFGHADAFALLAGHSKDMASFGADLHTRLHQQNPQSPLLSPLQERVTAAQTQAAAAEAHSRANQRYQLIAPDVFSETLHLPAGGTLTHVFNFTLRQQTTIAERAAPEGGMPAMAVSVRDFGDIADVSVLEEAAGRLVQLGGQVPEAAPRVHKTASLPKPPRG
ncbi:MAG TPA: hypothetical protein PLX33_12345 [Alphaproteobacteria bacterium]|nr:hypothetical protein [Alphaproteobacteria bacterium]